MKLSNLILVIVFAVLLIAPSGVSASPIACDADLFSAGAMTAIYGDTSPIILPDFQQYVIFDNRYSIRYSLYYSPTVNTGIFEIYRGKRLLGRAVNSTWEVCKTGNAWKNYLLVNGG